MTDKTKKQRRADAVENLSEMTYQNLGQILGVIEEPTDSVDHPAHYTGGYIECIDAIEASMSTNEFLGYLKGNAMKYLWRYQLKGSPSEDLKKARWYIDKLCETWEKWEGDEQ